ncbi:hypothetical protein [Streptomyces avermitilis]|uniref:hypothetical protein n=1 Tax=Streptomyces avermitilis TaxID=33903 RepID=UPI00339DB5D3
MSDLAAAQDLTEDGPSGDALLGEIADATSYPEDKPQVLPVMEVDGLLLAFVGLVLGEPYNDHVVEDRQVLEVQGHSCFRS